MSDTGHIHSSHGYAIFNTDTGVIVESQLDTIDWPIEHHPARVDIGELMLTYPGKDLADDWDILDVGYYTNDGTYEPPCEDWRADCRELSQYAT